MSRITTDVARAAEVLRGGGLVAMPTETVYGLAAAASNEGAVRRVFEVKQRPAGHPLIVHLAAAEQLPHWASEVPRAAAALAARCWPGPLTVLVPRAAHVLDAVTGGRGTVGLRVPAHPMALELIGRLGDGVAAPSANRFGRVSPTTAQHVLDDLGDAVDLVLDGGPCPVGVESTIVDCTTDPPQVLRSGGIPDEQVAAILGVALAPAEGDSRAPGMLVSHYAPAARVVLVDTAEQAVAEAAAGSSGGLRVEIIDGTADLVGYAHHLYAWLREADARRAGVVVAVLPPATGLGHAIRDRLRKAATPT